MSSITQCPQCNTRFKVSQEQLGAHQGLVRCGHCQVVFNATHYLYDDEPNPQLDLPILLSETQPKGYGKHAIPDDEDRHTHFPDGATSHSSKRPEDGDQEANYLSSSPAGGERSNGSLREPHVKPIPFGNTAQDEPQPSGHVKPSDGQPPLHETITVADHTTLPPITQNSAEKQEKAEAGVQARINTEQFTLAQQITSAEQPFMAASRPAKKIRSWPWAVGCLLLLAILLAQSAYYFRVRLAANLPGLKPALTYYCNLLLCTVSLPQDVEQISIESSDMEVVDPLQASVITFNALLRNHAPYPQAYPNLELTLTDSQDKALARRIFHPAEYLKAGEDEKQGVPANREISVRLHLDTTDLKPTGFRLFLFYPQ